MKTLDDIILNRLRQSPPKDYSVVPGSTPVIAFGKFRSAKVATISLNPSYHEFDIVKGERRFHTLESLAITKYEEINETHKNLVLDYCERYFERPGIVYSDWFDRINLIGWNTYLKYAGKDTIEILSQWVGQEIQIFKSQK